MNHFRVPAAFAIAASFLLFAVPAAAADPSEGRFRVGITGGTLGVGPEIGYRLSERFGVRANLTFLSVHHGFDSDDVDYRGKVKLGSGGAMIDLYPFSGGFFVSGGARINGNKARARGTPDDITEIGDNDYTPAQIGTLRARAETKDFAPQLTMGYSGGLHPGFSFGFEAGALFQGRVRIPTLTASGGGVLASDLAIERDSLRDDVDDFKAYPIVQLRIAYRF